MTSDFFNDQMRRDPFSVYAQMREASPVFHVPPPFDAWLIFDYESVKRVLNDHHAFSSNVPAPKNWFIFLDPPIHSKLRGLISKAFTPKVIAEIEIGIRQLSRQLLDEHMSGTEMDLVAEYSVPLPMKVIAGMIGIPLNDWPLFKHWSDVIVRLSYARSGGEDAARASADFKTVTAEMDGYLQKMIAQRRDHPCGDLLTRLIEAEVDGEHLTQEEILGFFQLLVVGGQETTTNLINNAVICLLENRAELDRLRKTPTLLPSTIEEVLRFRSPLQWVMRKPRQNIEIHGKVIPAEKLVLPIIGSANRDARQFSDPDRFDISREHNPHLAFGHGIHSCLGAALARMEARIALTDLFARLEDLELATPGQWEPRKALHVHGPARLPVKFRKAHPAAN